MNKEFNIMMGDTINRWIDDNQSVLTEASDQIWQFAEIALHEQKSATVLKEILGNNGFQVESDLAGMPTAFRASWGNGKPVIGFLGEYDALPELNQKTLPHQEPAVEGGSGHGCGHNLLGVGSLGAALALKAEMEKDNLPGTVVYLGCPAEEIMTGKIYMARDGYFNDLDIALSWHPFSVNTVLEQSFAAMNNVKFHFYGKTAHAAMNPEHGRSALDAVELMNVGVNYLREHVPSDVRMHYTISNGGGEPNVVPQYAQVWYYIRAPRREGVDAVYERVIKVAQGAALMTETELKVELLTGCYHTLINQTLNQVLHDCLEKAPGPSWSDEDLEFARKVNETFSPGQKEMQLNFFNAPEIVEQNLHEGIIPLTGKSMVMPGSTDVSDVSWITPTAQISTCCQVIGSAGHTWQITAASGMSIGHKGMLYAAKALAMAGSRLLREDGLLAEARKEFQKSTEGREYKSVIPKGAVPSN